MPADHVEVLPADADLSQRLPELAPLAQGEGWAIYAGPGEGAWWVVRDEQAGEDEEVDGAFEGYLRLERYDDRAAWSAVCERIAAGDVL